MRPSSTPLQFGNLTDPSAFVDFLPATRPQCVLLSTSLAYQSKEKREMNSLTHTNHADHIEPDVDALNLFSLSVVDVVFGAAGCHFN